MAEKGNGTKIPCVFQEPLFSEDDEAFISSLGHQVVRHPAAYRMVDDRSLLFGIHLYRPIYALALTHARPAIFVGTPWDVWEQYVNNNNNNNKNKPPPPRGFTFNTVLTYTTQS